MDLRLIVKSGFPYPPTSGGASHKQSPHLSGPILNQYGIESVMGPWTSVLGNVGVATVSWLFEFALESD